MSANWSFGINEARGEFITVIGDDDGMCDFACDIAEAALSQSGAQVVHWTPSLYWWPCCSNRKVANTLKVHFGRAQGTAIWRRIDLGLLLKVALQDVREWYQLPMVYNSFVHRDVFSRFRAEWGDHFLFAVCPDIYSGVALSCTGVSAVELDCALNVHGLSSRSNGEAHVVATGNNEIREDFSTLLRSEGITDLPEIANIGVFAYGLADSFYRFKKLNPNAAAPYELNRTTLARNQASEIAESNDSFDVRLAYLEKLSDFFKPEHMPARAVERVRAVFLADRTRFDCGQRSDVIYGLGHGIGFLDGSKFGLESIADATAFVSNLFSVRQSCNEQDGMNNRAFYKKCFPPFVLDAYRAIKSRLEK